MIISFSHPIHIVILLVSAFSISISMIVLIRIPNRFGYIVGPFTYFINVFLYNLSLHFGTIDYETAEIWSGAIRLHSLFILTIIILTLEKVVGKGK